MRTKEEIIADDKGEAHRNDAMNYGYNAALTLLDGGTFDAARPDLLSAAEAEERARAEHYLRYRLHQCDERGHFTADGSGALIGGERVAWTAGEHFDAVVERAAKAGRERASLALTAAPLSSVRGSRGDVVFLGYSPRATCADLDLLCDNDWLSRTPRAQAMIESRARAAPDGSDIDYAREHRCHASGIHPRGEACHCQCDSCEGWRPLVVGALVLIDDDGRLRRTRRPEDAIGAVLRVDTLGDVMVRHKGPREYDALYPGGRAVRVSGEGQ